MDQLKLPLEHSFAQQRKARTPTEQRLWAAEQWEKFAATATPEFLVEICRETAATTPAPVRR